MKKNKQRVLVVASHPDDEILGCGGTMAKLSSEGHEVSTLILGEGITSRDDARDEGLRTKELSSLNSDVTKANKIVGVKNIFTHNFPDNRFDSVALLDVVKVVEKIKKKLKPTIIFTHHRGDTNIDHRVTFDAVITASRAMKGESVKEIYAFEVLSSTEWQYAHPSLVFLPTKYVSIQGFVSKKVSAMKKYTSEIRKYPHPRSIEGIEILAKKRGLEVGLRAAEAFEVIRIIRS